MQARIEHNVLQWTTLVFPYAKLHISMRVQNSWDVTKSKIYHFTQTNYSIYERNKYRI